MRFALGWSVTGIAALAFAWLVTPPDILTVILASAVGLVCSLVYPIGWWIGRRLPAPVVNWGAALFVGVFGHALGAAMRFSVERQLLSHSADPSSQLAIASLTAIVIPSLASAIAFGLAFSFESVDE